MDLATIIGFALGFGAVAYGIVGSGVPFSAFIDPPSLLIVLGGTIAALLIKLFDDRQLRVSDGVVEFLLARMERSFEAARRLVTALDEAALTNRRNITVPLARQVLDDLDNRQ